jgi:hypothetical protein
MDGSRTTSNEVRDTLAIMWGEDPVHPARDCYQSLAEHLEELFLRQGGGGSTTTSTASERPLKRPRWLEEDSNSLVVPRSMNTGGGRGRGGRGGRGGFRGRVGFQRK